MNRPQVARVSPNPFATRFIRPGALEYVFPAGQSAEAVLRTLAQSPRSGQIIGPHGSGKSTLVASLVRQWELAGHRAWVCCLRDGQRRLPADWRQRARLAAAELIIIDGYDQLSGWSRFKVERACRQQAWSLLVTAHEDAGYPTLCAVNPSLQVAQELVQRLLGTASSAISRQMVAEQFSAVGGDLREMLFALYDIVESQSAEQASPPASEPNAR